MFNFKHILLLLSLFISLQASSQIAWEKLYGLPNIDEYLNFITPAEEPGLFWAAGITGSVGQDDFIVMKLDTSGHIIWADTLGSPLHNEYLWCFNREPSTGEMWLSGSRTNFENNETYSVLIKLTSDGAFIFEKTSAQPVHGTTGYVSIAGFADGGAAVVSHELPYGSGQLLRLDANGNTTFSENLPTTGSYSSAPQLLSALPDGRFYMFRNSGFDSNNNAMPKLSLRESTGNLIWEKSIQAAAGIGQTVIHGLIADKNDGSVYTLTRELDSNIKYITKTTIDSSEVWSVKPTTYYLGSRLKMGPDSTIALITPRGIELRNRVDGEKVSQHDFSSGALYWDRQLFDADFLPDGRGGYVGMQVAGGSKDAWYVLFEKGTMEILNDNIIGTVGPLGGDEDPFVTAAGNFLFLASMYDANDTLDYEIQLRKIAPADGTEIWTREFSGPDRDLLRALATTSDDKLLVVSENLPLTSGQLFNEIVIRKINPEDGTEIWKTQIPNEGYLYRTAAVATSDGGALVIFRGNVPNPTGQGSIELQFKAARIDANGGIVWQTWIAPVWSPIQSNSQRLIENIIALSDGDFLAVGMEKGHSGLILRINGTTGASQLVSLLEPVATNNIRIATSAITTATGDFLVAVPNINGSASNDSLLLYRLSPDGNILQRKAIRLASSHTPSRLLKTADGGFFLLLSYNTNTLGGMIVRRINENFETLAETELYTILWRLNSATVLPDGSMAVTREVFPTNSWDIMLAKTEVLPTVSTSPVPIESTRLLVSPNPAGLNDVLHITLDHQFSGKCRIEILMPDGRLFSSFEKTKTEQVQVFELENLPENTSCWIRVVCGDNSESQWISRF